MSIRREDEGGFSADECAIRVVAVCSYAESVGATHFLTSAKQNKGLEECFLDLTASE